MYPHSFIDLLQKRTKSERTDERERERERERVSVGVAVDLAAATSRLDKGNARKRISSPSLAPLSSRVHIVFGCMHADRVTFSERVMCILG